MFATVLKFPAASRIIRSCDWSMRSGSFVSIDTNKIGRPCTCTVNSLFVGDLLVTSLKVTADLCNTRVIVNNTIIFNCNEVGSSTFKVRVNDTLIVKAEHMSANITDNFTQCLGFRENGNCLQLSVLNKLNFNLEMTFTSSSDLLKKQYFRSLDIFEIMSKFVDLYVSHGHNERQME